MSDAVERTVGARIPNRWYVRLGQVEMISTDKANANRAFWILF
jgi:hypothetical protein